MRRLEVFLLLLLAPWLRDFHCLAAAEGPTAATSSKPNVLLIGIDDLNDWIGCLGGHPQAKTPHLDALAKRGVLFHNAHCQSPVCNPSRASMMTSLYPESSGIYFLNPDIASSPVGKASITLPKRFEREGYHVTAAGKLFHGRENALYFKHYAGSKGGFGPRPKKKISQPHGHPLWDWGAFPDTNEKMPDYQLAAWAANELKSLKTDQPFFLAVGFYRPHVPMYAPKEWFDLHPLDKIQLPRVTGDDLADLSDYAINITRLEHVAPTHKWIEESGEWPHAVQSYLASVSFVDACVGTVLDALDASPHRDNTIIVMFSDHGFHLGEKDRWAKRSLWEDGVRVPVIIVAPGLTTGQYCHKPIGLIDLYPTLLDLVGLDPDPRHEGHSLKPLLENPKAHWPHLARTSFGPGNVALRSERYRYIRYVDGSEEFYDLQEDPHEWTNLAGQPEMQALVKQHAAHLPNRFAEILGKGSTGHKSYAASGDPAVRHSFLGVGKANGAVIVGEDGRVQWTFDMPASDGWVLPNGNVLLALYPTTDFPHGGVVEVERKTKKIVFQYQGQQKEVSTVQPLPGGKFLVAELGPDPRALVINRDGEILKTTPLQCQKKNFHMQTRMLRMLPNGNYIAPHLLDFSVKEYHPDTGEVVRAFATDDRGRDKHDWPFTGIRLQDGNTLIACTNGNRIIEVDEVGRIVWSVTNEDLGEDLFDDACGAQRLPNGNTVIASYHAKGDQVKLFEVTRQKKVVWRYSGMKNGFHHFQILTTNGKPVRDNTWK